MRILLFLFLLLPKSNTDDIDMIIRAIASGQINTVEHYLDRTVEVSLPTREETVTKEQAIVLLKAFFEKHSPKGFSEVHQGTSRGNDSIYYIGNLTTNAGDYRMYLLIYLNNGKPLIQEIRFSQI
jgi:hypothetical protein